MVAADDSKKRGLGRGLSALFGEEAAVNEATTSPAAGDGVRHMPVGDLRPGKYQPRQHFDDESLAGLADSIREKGVLEPILIRERPDGGGYEIIAGERRWRAAQLAKLHEVPVLLREFTDRDALEIALIENIHRDDLSALEEAEAYKRLIDEFEHTQDALAKAIGKSRSHVANTLRLLGLPDPVKAQIRQGALSAGHARALLTADDVETLAQEVVKKGLNVRQTERLARRGKPLSLIHISEPTRPMKESRMTASA